MSRMRSTPNRSCIQISLGDLS